MNKIDLGITMQTYIDGLTTIKKATTRSERLEGVELFKQAKEKLIRAGCAPEVITKVRREIIIELRK